MRDPAGTSLCASHSRFRRRFRRLGLCSPRHAELSSSVVPRVLIEPVRHGADPPGWPDFVQCEQAPAGNLESGIVEEPSQTRQEHTAGSSGRAKAGLRRLPLRMASRGAPPGPSPARRPLGTGESRTSGSSLSRFQARPSAAAGAAARIREEDPWPAAHDRGGASGRTAGGAGRLPWCAAGLLGWALRDHRLRRGAAPAREPHQAVARARPTPSDSTSTTACCFPPISMPRPTPA